MVLRIRIVAALVLVAALVAGCGRASSPTRPVTPDPGNAFYACGSWSPQKPAVGVAVFDLHVIGSDPRAAIEGAGGTVLHEYQVPLVRARLTVRAVQDLHAAGAVWFARQVGERQPLEFDGVVAIPTPLSPADLDFLAAAGVTVVEVAYGGGAFRARIPDAATPALRQYPGVRYVELNTVACVSK